MLLFVNCVLSDVLISFLILLLILIEINVLLLLLVIIRCNAVVKLPDVLQ
jgi:hypothetical protein